MRIGAYLNSISMNDEHIRAWEYIKNLHSPYVSMYSALELITTSSKAESEARLTNKPCGR